MAAFYKGTATSGGLAAVQIARAYWEGLRPAEGGLPLRSAVDPRGLAPVLDRMFLAEPVAPGQLRLRIAGTGLTALAGVEMKGLPLSLLFRAEARAALAEACRAVVETPAVVEIEAEAERGLLRPALAVRLLMMPLAAEEVGSARRVLGCLASEGAPGRAPRQLAIARVACLPLTAAALSALSPPVAEQPLAALSGPVARHHLRLVHSS